MPRRPWAPTGNWRIRAEQIVLLYRNTPAILASSIASCVLIGAVLWDAAPAAAIVVWIGLMMAVSAGRLCLVLAFRRFARTEDMERWEGYALVGIACGSVLWGAGLAWLLPAESFPLRVFIGFAVALMAAGAVVTLCALPAGFRIFVFAMVTPLVARMALIGDTGDIGMAGMLVLYSCLLIVVGNSVNHALVRSLALRFENLDLIARLDSARMAAEAANRSKAEFLTQISHELRTPLNAVLGFADLLRGPKEVPLDPGRRRRHIEDIHASGSHLLRLINDILGLAKVEAGKLEPHESMVDLKEALRGCAASLEVEAKQAGVALRLNCADDLPFLFADSRMVNQIAGNLLSNAVQLTPPGGSVEMSAWVDAGGLSILVANAGLGGKFSDRSTPPTALAATDLVAAQAAIGARLGLPLARHLVELHQGTLSMSSDPTLGTSAIVRFPRERSSRPSGAA